MKPIDSFDARTTLPLAGENVRISSLRRIEGAGFPNVARLPFSLKVLLENLLRHEDGRFVKAEDIEALARWDPGRSVEKEIAFTPARVLLQDFTGVPAVVDLAAMRRLRFQPLVYRTAMVTGPKRLTRDVRIIHRQLIAAGRAVWLGQDFPPRTPPPLADVERAAARVKALFVESDSGPETAPARPATTRSAA